MYCPTCEAEYEAGITRCADDGAELVEKLTTEGGASDDSEARFIMLHTMSSPAEAEMVHDILRQNGIRAVIQSGGADAFSPLLSQVSPGGVLVDERDFDRAQEIYSSFFGDDTSPLTGPASDENDEESE
ncbi:MAG: DUF2007 domain-containing protein [Acidobacteriota bacterium]